MASSLSSSHIPFYLLPIAPSSSSSINSPHQRLFFYPIRSLFGSNRLRTGHTPMTSKFGRVYAHCRSKEEMRDQHRCSDSSSRLMFTEGIKRLECALAAVLVAVQISSPLPLSGLDEYLIPPAKAVLYSPDTKVPRTGELALRRAIPANTSMKTIQNSAKEAIRNDGGKCEEGLEAKDEKDTILSSMPVDLKEKGSILYASLIDGKGGLEALLKNIKDKDPDKVSLGLASALDTVAELELLQAPGLQFLLPEQYVKYPRLTGRGIVEFTIEKGDGSAFLPEAGVGKSTATIQVVIDGFSAPLTAGNFAKLVIDGVYNGTKLSITDQAVLSDSTLDRNTGYSFPLEIKPSGQFEPLYKTTLSVQYERVQGFSLVQLQAPHLL